MITSFGIISFRKLKGKWQVLLIQHVNGQHWGFPKGRTEKTETARETAIRELKEETGLHVQKFLSLEPFTESYDNQEKSKTVRYFSALVIGGLKCQPDEIMQAKWLDLDEAMKQISFPESQHVFKQARKHLDGYIRKWASWIKKPTQESIQVFVRHCHYSEISEYKERYRSFDKELCLANLLNTMDDPKIKVTFLLDTFHPCEMPHFIHKQKRFPVLEIQGGTETASFLWMLDYVVSQKFSDQTIIYFLEDDYVHLPHWCRILRESFTLPGVDYVTLYDHKDKYFLPEYQNLSAKIFHTNSCHWRTTPSTTNTYAMRYKTLIRDIEIHRSFSLNRSVTDDHGKFLKLNEQGSVLISAMPGWATHAEPKYASPCTDWELVLSHTKKSN